MSKYFLILDTSTSQSIVILAKDNTSIDHKNIEYTKDVSNLLFQNIKDILKKNNITLSQLSAIGIGTGPGSYTGIRVGVAIAKSLSFGLKKIPLIGFCSLKSYVPNEDTTFYAALDAKSGGIYILKGKKEKRNVSYLSKPHLIPLSDIEKSLSKDILIISPHEKILKEKLSKKFSIHPESINADHLAKLIFEKYEKNNFNLSDKLKLLYLRGPKPIAL